MANLPWATTVLLVGCRERRHCAVWSLVARPVLFSAPVERSGRCPAPSICWHIRVPRMLMRVLRHIVASETMRDIFLWSAKGKSVSFGNEGRRVCRGRRAWGLTFFKFAALTGTDASGQTTLQNCAAQFIGGNPNNAPTVLGSAPSQPFGSNRHLCYWDDSSSFFAIEYWPEEFAPRWAAYKLSPENYDSDTVARPTRATARTATSRKRAGRRWKAAPMPATLSTGNIYSTLRSWRRAISRTPGTIAATSRRGRHSPGMSARRTRPSPWRTCRRNGPSSTRTSGSSWSARS